MKARRGEPGALQRPADQDDGTNHYIRVFRGRAQQIAQRYGPAISAYEVVNEPNINYELWNATGLHTAEIKPERYATLIDETYRNIKTVAPAAQVIIGGMLLGPPPNDNTHDELDWLYQLYVAPAVQAYQAAGDGGAARLERGALGRRGPASLLGERRQVPATAARDGAEAARPGRLPQPDLGDGDRAGGRAVGPRPAALRR